MIFVTVSTGHFDPLIEACDGLRDRFDFHGQIGSGIYVPSFSHFRTGVSSEIEAKMKEAELVIAHAGTGMLSMLYRMKKRAVVCPKQVRYGEANDSQVELALKWAELGMATLCLDVDKIERAIEKCREFSPTFPEFPSLGVTLREQVSAGGALRGAVAPRASARR